jgi:hypothetical protein
LENENDIKGPALPKGEGNIGDGIGMGCLVQLGFIIIPLLVGKAMGGGLYGIGYQVIFVGAFFGITQWALLGPLLWFHRAKTQTVKGLLIIGGIAFLLTLGFWLPVIRIQNARIGSAFRTYSTQAVIPAPQVVNVSLPAVATSVPTNARISIQFDRSISPANLDGVRLLHGTELVPTDMQLADGNKVLTLMPKKLLLPDTDYALSVQGVTGGPGGRPNPIFWQSFTTGKRAGP